MNNILKIKNIDNEQKILNYLSLEIINLLIKDTIKKNLSRITFDINHIRKTDSDLANSILENPSELIQLFEKILLQYIKGQKFQYDLIQYMAIEKIHINIKGISNSNLLNPKDLKPEFNNKYIEIKGIVTGISKVRIIKENDVLFQYEKNKFKDF